MNNTCVISIGSLASFSRGLTYSRNDEVDFSENVVLRSNNIDLATNTLNYDELKYISDAIVIPNDKKLQRNSIFMCMSNGSKQHLGKVAYIDKDYPYAFGGFMGLIRPNEELIVPKLLYYYFCSSKFKRFLSSIGNGANINNIKFVDIAKDCISIPEKLIQQSIVVELDKINELISLKKEQLKDYDNLAQSIFYEMFGDPVVNEKGWEVKKLGELCVSKLKYGSGASAVDFDGNIRYVRITDINEDGTLNNDIKSPNIVDDEYLLNVGDIVFARSGATVGKTYLHRKNNIKCLYAGYLIKATLNTKMALPIYVFQFTQSKYYKDWVNLNARAVAQPNINAKQYGDLQIPLPPLTLQQVFAQRIELIEQQKAEIQSTIADLETLLASRMQYWFD